MAQYNKFDDFIKELAEKIGAVPDEDIKVTLAPPPKGKIVTYETPGVFPPVHPNCRSTIQTSVDAGALLPDEVADMFLDKIARAAALPPDYLRGSGPRDLMGSSSRNLEGRAGPALLSDFEPEVLDPEVLQALAEHALQTPLLDAPEAFEVLGRILVELDQLNPPKPGLGSKRARRFERQQVLEAARCRVPYFVQLDERVYSNPFREIEDRVQRALASVLSPSGMMVNLGTSMIDGFKAGVDAAAKNVEKALTEALKQSSTLDIGSIKVSDTKLDDENLTMTVSARAKAVYHETIEVRIKAGLEEK